MLASSRKTSINNYPTSLTSTQVSGKSILIQSKNSHNTDGNYLYDKATNGSAPTSSSYTYNTTSSYSTQMLAFNNIRHYNWVGNYLWQGDVIDMN
jgi:hypothetical protein